MATLAAIQKQIAELEKKAEAIRRSEVAAAVAQIRSLVERYGLSAADVGLTGKAAKSPKVRANVSARKPAGVPKYQNPKTGRTWTGVGKPPAWIAGKKNREAFLINGADSPPTARAEPAAKLPTAKKAGATATVKGQRAAKSAEAAGKSQVASPTRAARKAKVAGAANTAAVVAAGESMPEAASAG